MALSGWLIAILLAAPFDHAGGQESKGLALLPFENVSGSVAGAQIIMPLVERLARQKGYALRSAEAVETFLTRHRIRNTGMLSRAQLMNLRREVGVELALVGSVDLFHSSGENPQWGLSSRVLSTETGTVLWANSNGLTGGDFTGLLGIGTITSSARLAEESVKLLFQNLPASGAAFAAPTAQGKPTTGWFRLRSGYRSPWLDSVSRLRVAVAIFENASERRGAGRILADVLTTALFRHGRFHLVDPGEVNETLIALGRAPYAGADTATLKEFKKRTEIDAIFRGTVYRYNEGIKREATTSPEIALDITMLDAENGKIVWFAGAERKGDEYQIVLDFGLIRSMVPLIQRTLSEMLQSL